MKSKINETFAGLFSGGEDRGVSPVIGVILMVAITVILAAVIGAFMLGLGDGLSTDPRAGVNVNGDETSEITVSLTSLDNADGVAIVDDSGELVEDADLRNIGASYNLNSTESGGELGAYSVVAYQGDDFGNSSAEATVRELTLE